MSRHALFRGADRRGRHDGERLSCAGMHRGPPCARTFRQSFAGRVRETLSRCGERRSAQDHFEDGHRGHLVLSRRLSVRGGWAFALDGGGYFSRHAEPHFRYRTCPASPRKVARLHARAFDEDVIALPMGGFYKARVGGETHAHAAHLIHLLQSAVASDSYATYQEIFRRRLGVAAGFACGI